MRVIDRFQGAWLGAAMASSPQGSRSFQTLFEQEALTISSLQNIQFPTVNRPEQTEGLTLIHILIMSLLLHGTPMERSQTRQRLLFETTPSPGDTAVLELLSELIAAQFTPPDPPLQLNTDAQRIWASIQAAIMQQLPLQDAIATLRQFPQMSPWGQDIAIALYGWRCTPHNPSIAIARVERGLGYPSNSARSRDFMPQLTGFLNGLTQELPCPKGSISQGIQHLFNHWAGINPHHPHPPSPNELIIFAPGILKPRPSA